MLDTIKTVGLEKAMDFMAAFLILLIGFKTISFVEKRIIRRQAWLKMDVTLQVFLRSAMRMASKTLVIVSAIMAAGVPESTFIAILGAAGLAIGLALQGSLSNLAAVVLIITLRPFKVGDYIEGAGHGGTVTDIGLFYTRLTTPDNRAIIIPNSNLAGSSVTNYGFYETRRLDLEFGVDYVSDIETVKAVILREIQEHPVTLNEPEPFVRLARHADSSLLFKVRVWVATENYWALNWDLQENIKRALDINGIEIPYPHVVVQQKVASK